MIDKLSLIRRLLDTDEETDLKILSILDAAHATGDEAISKIVVEGRRTTRSPVYLDADINTGKEKIHAEIGDISMEGAYIKTRRQITKGEHVALRLSGPDGEEIALMSKVVRIDDNGFGVQFESIDGPNRKKIEALIQRH